MNLSWNPACIYSNIIKLTWRSKCPGKLYGLGQVYPAPLHLCTISASSSEKGWIKFWFQPFGLCSSPMLFFSLFSRLSRVPAAEDLASGMLTAFPQGLISVQDALLDGLFSPLPPQLYQVPAGKLSFDFILPRKSFFACYLLWVSSILWKFLLFTQMSLFWLPSLPTPICCKVYFPLQIWHLVFLFSSTWPQC